VLIFAVIAGDEFGANCLSALGAMVLKLADFGAQYQTPILAEPHHFRQPALSGGEPNVPSSGIAPAA